MSFWARCKPDYLSIAICSERTAAIANEATAVNVIAGMQTIWHFLMLY
ncbi:MAG: hypothetical protein R2807_00390 [Chitinophagales bacterium]